MGRNSYTLTLPHLFSFFFSHPHFLSCPTPSSWIQEDYRPYNVCVTLLGTPGTPLPGCWDGDSRPGDKEKICVHTTYPRMFIILQ